jgi:hypothetical protein
MSLLSASPDFLEILLQIEILVVVQTRMDSRPGTGDSTSIVTCPFNNSGTCGISEVTGSRNAMLVALRSKASL